MITGISRRSPVVCGGVPARVRFLTRFRDQVMFIERLVNKEGGKLENIQDVRGSRVANALSKCKEVRRKESFDSS